MFKVASNPNHSVISKGRFQTFLPWRRRETQPWSPALGRGVTDVDPSYVGLGQHFSSSQGMWKEGAFLDS